MRVTAGASSVPFAWNRRPLHPVGISNPSSDTYDTYAHRAGISIYELSSKTEERKSDLLRTEESQFNGSGWTILEYACPLYASQRGHYYTRMDVMGHRLK
jgi:hypothetical protein